ncbi:Protein cps3 [Tetrabaena socialis]|uniref:Protein cps3 n=1 Tax=Tetrabaena socialis TaxID=47790 RepID=A0A2J8ADP3_9CHLO|nr:Protein cps3 [Tetrabaena socialis]|eukprot:PNH10633.1 Protein cps3 [Tetrabaena socialis]
MPRVTLHGIMSNSSVPCKFFAQGYCAKGRDCPFKHGSAAGSNGLPCKFFSQAGGCNKGANCQFLHGGVPAARYMSFAPNTPAKPAGGRQSNSPAPARGRAAAAGSSPPRGRASSACRGRPQQRPDSAPFGGAGGGGGILGNLLQRPQQFAGTLQLGGGQSARVQVQVQQQMVTTKPQLAVHAYFLIGAYVVSCRVSGSGSLRQLGGAVGTRLGTRSSGTPDGCVVCDRFRSWCGHGPPLLGRRAWAATERMERCHTHTTGHPARAMVAASAVVLALLQALVSS